MRTNTRTINERDEHLLIPLLLVCSCCNAIAIFYFAYQYWTAARGLYHADFIAQNLTVYADYASFQVLVMLTSLLLQIVSMMFKRRWLHFLTLAVSAFFLLNIFYRWY